MSLNKQLHLPGIHALRALAAIVVFLYHLHLVGIVPIPKSGFYLAAYGWLAVQLFFVVSAFSLLYSNQKHITTKGWMKPYFIKRFFRIAPLFYFLLMFHCFRIIYLDNASIDIESIIINTLFLFNFSQAESFGLVWVSWSVGVEMAFYLILPFIMMMTRSLYTSIIVYICLVSISLLFRYYAASNYTYSFLYSHMALLAQLGVFASGILMYWVYAKSKELAQIKVSIIKWLALIATIALVCFLISDLGINLLASQNTHPAIQLWALAFGFATLFVSLSTNKLLNLPMVQYLGERSYSIYLIHQVVIIYARPYLLPLYDFFYPSLGGYSFYICGLCVLVPILALSELTYRFIEVPGINFGKKLISSRQLTSN